MELSANKRTYTGLFLVALATLMYEILLTRIFSVTLWYHFAFLAVSVAMFGMTVGAIVVYLTPNIAGPWVKHEIAFCSLLFALSAVVSILYHLSTPIASKVSLAALESLAWTYVVISIPFVFSGITVCLNLTKFPRQVSKLYAADLVGAAAGCVLLVYALELTDGPTAVFVAAFFASAGALLFASDAGSKILAWVAASFCVLSCALVLTNARLMKNQTSLLRLTWAKGTYQRPPLYEKWNSFSRIIVEDVPVSREKPFGWGLSPTYSSDLKTQQLFLNIDATAGSVLTAFDGDASRLEYLKYDVTNVAHFLRPDATVLVVGAGGGRDVLSALVFGQKSVLAIEINEDILGAVNGKFGDFTGHLDRNPKVTFVNDEARSYTARLKDQFDIIQVSLIDTWAATAAGAYILSENSLYTLQAWEVLFRHLTPRGVLSVSRWYHRALPGEVYRAASLASATLLQEGIADPRGHIVILRIMKRLSLKGVEEGPDGVATILVSKLPFSADDLSRIDDISRKMQFEVVSSPRFSQDITFLDLTSGKDPARVGASFSLNLAPPTDDCPFFFNLLRLRDVGNRALWSGEGMTFNLNAVSLLAFMLLVVTGLTLLCIMVPLFLTTRKETLSGALPHFLFFGAIGLGFMLIEISQMERLIIFLGHPTYGLSVVLFTLLLSCGLGSYSTTFIKAGQRGRAAARLLFLLGILTVFGLLTPRILEAFQTSTTPGRILVAAIMLFPLGFAMGAPFPLGLKLAARQSDALTPWLWGINGATSVYASVLAVAIALEGGISTSFWVGFSCYALAFGVFTWTSRQQARVLAPNL